MTGKLFIVATPIGNYRDITLRALDVIKEADAVICEEFRQGSTILKKIGAGKKDLIQLNEHNEDEESQTIATEMLMGKTYALISDCGTPAFADPGTSLVRTCIEYNIPVIPVPGPSSLMAAISVSPLPLETFFFAGFLSRKTEERKQQLLQYRNLQAPLIIMESPYRLEKLLEEISRVFGKGQQITLAYNLTLDGEHVYHDSVAQVLKAVKNKKGEFVLIIHR
jgi:16S rRNA (cytidine1402-2'-O)-methyltransferase